MFRLVRNTPFGIKNDIFSGIGVSLVGIGYVILLCSITGIDFRYGIIGFCIANLIAFAFGARPGMISGPFYIAMLAVYPLVARYGVQYLFLTIICSGLLQVIFALLRLGKYVRMMPRAVILGAIAGLSILIFLQYARTLLIPDENGIDTIIQTEWLVPVAIIFILIPTGLVFIPKLFKFIPAGLVLIIIVSAVFVFTKIGTPGLLEYSKIRGSIPFRPYFLNFKAFPWIPLNLETLVIIGPSVLTLTVMGIFQSLFVLSFTDELTNTRGKTNRESLSQGIANILSGIAGGTPVSAMLPSTMVNLQMGGKGQISALVVSLIASVVAFVYPEVLDYVPAYLMFAIGAVVIAETFIRASIFQFTRTRFWNIFILVLVAATTVLFSFIYGIILGVILSSSIFAWENARRIRVRKRIDDTGVKYYELYGPLFFGSAPIFKQKVDLDTDPEEVVFDFLESKVMDYEGAKALFQIIGQYNEAGKKVKIKYISPDMKRLIHKEEIQVEIIDNESDPTYTILIDELS